MNDPLILRAGEPEAIDDRYEPKRLMFPILDGETSTKDYKGVSVAFKPTLFIDFASGFFQCPFENPLHPGIKDSYVKDNTSTYYRGRMGYFINGSRMKGIEGLEGGIEIVADFEPERMFAMRLGRVRYWPIIHAHRGFQLVHHHASLSNNPPKQLRMATEAVWGYRSYLYQQERVLNTLTELMRENGNEMNESERGIIEQAGTAIGSIDFHAKFIGKLRADYPLKHEVLDEILRSFPKDSYGNTIKPHEPLYFVVASEEIGNREIMERMRRVEKRIQRKWRGI